MIAKAQARYIRITPRKFRQIIPLIKGRNPEEAIAVLTNVKKRASEYAIELLKSAIANAKRLHQGIDVSDLYISNILANCGPSLKRYRAASMGRASPILKRTSHILVELDVREHHEEAAKTKKALKRSNEPVHPKGEVKKHKPVKQEARIKSIRHKEKDGA